MWKSGFVAAALIVATTSFSHAVPVKSVDLGLPCANNATEAVMRTNERYSVDLRPIDHDWNSYESGAFQLEGENKLFVVRDANAGYTGLIVQFEFNPADVRYCFLHGWRDKGRSKELDPELKKKMRGLPRHDH